MQNHVETAAQAPAGNRRARLMATGALLIALSALTVLAVSGTREGSNAPAPAAAAATGMAATAPQQAITGEWTADFQREKSEEKLHLNIMRKSGGHNSNMGSGVTFSELEGLNREQVSGPLTNVKFRMVREAGTFDFEGTFREGKGAGFWTLTPSQSFLSAMASRGFDNLDEEKRVASAMLDVRTKTVDDLKSAGFDRISYDDVIKATIFKVTPEFISELKSIGYENLDLEELVKARIFKIDAAFAREVESMGFARGSLENLVKMRIFKVTPQFMNEMRAAGLNNLSVEDLVKLRIFKIDAEFIQKAKAAGNSNPDVEELVRMKIFSKDKDKGK